MNLPEDLIKEFGALLGSTEKARTDKNVYGTVTRKSISAMYVQLDGSDLETPVAYTTDAEVGDRVLVMIKDHKATITGNVSSPVNARANDKFLKFSSEGLRIGILDSNGNPTGYSILIDGSTYYIKDKNNVTVAQLGANIVSLLMGQGIMQVIDGVLYLMGQKAAGFRSKHEDTSYRAEVVTKCDPTASDWGTNTNPAVSLQVVHPDSSVANHSTVVSSAGVYIDGIKQTNLGKVYEKTVVLTNEATRTSFQGGEIGAKVLTTTLPAPPSGYRYYGISSILFDLGRMDTTVSPNPIWNNNYYHPHNYLYCVRNAGIDPATRKLHVSVINESHTPASPKFYEFARIKVTCFALPVAETVAGGTVTIDF